MTESTTADPRLEQARALVAHLEAGDRQAADRVLRELGARDDNALFHELGRLTRELHEAINGFLLDARIQDLAHQEIPDAAERLKYVIAMTEQAANTTLNAVEESMPLLDSLQDGAGRLSGEWQRFRERQLKVGDFRELAQDLGLFLDQVHEDSERLHGKLSEVLLAQDFQDLTGQIIRKVIALVQNLEDKLVQLIRITGESQAEPGRKKSRDDPAVLEGPVVPGLDQGNVVHGQDEVDDLLSSLGF